MQLYLVFDNVYLKQTQYWYCHPSIEYNGCNCNQTGSCEKYLPYFTDGVAYR